MKYYVRVQTGGFELVEDQDRIELPQQQAGLISIPDHEELQALSITIISDIKTTKIALKDELLIAIQKSKSIQETYEVMLHAYKNILPKDSNIRFSMYFGSGILAKAIRIIFSKYMHMQLGEKLNEVGEVSVTAKIPGIRTLLFKQDHHEDFLHDKPLEKNNKSKS